MSLWNMLYVVYDIFNVKSPLFRDTMVKGDIDLTLSSRKNNYINKN